MATLQKIRQRGVLLTVVIGLAMLAFIIGGIDFNTFTGNSRTVVADVNGDEVKIMEYERMLDEMTTFYQIETGMSSLDENTTMQIRNAVWNLWLNGQLVAQQCEKLGIVVSDDEIAANLSAATPHPMLMQLRSFYNPEKQAFDPALLSEFAKMLSEGMATPEMQKYWQYIQRNVKMQLLQDKYAALTGASFNFNRIDARDAYNDKQTYKLEYVSRPYFSVPDSSVSVSDAEMQARYKLDKENMARKAEERTIGVISFDIEPSQDDFDEVKAWVDKLWPEFSTSGDFISLSNQNSDVNYDGIAKSRADVDKDLADFAFSGKAGDTFAPKLFGNTYKMARIVESGISAPDSVRARHILVLESSQERTKAVADSLVAELAKGADFADLAKRHSKAASAQAGGDLGWFKEGEIDKDFSVACFNARTGKAFIYPMGQVLQVIEVTEKTKPVEKVKLCVLQREVEAGSRTYANLFNDANQYAAKYNNSSLFADSAKTLDGVYYRTYTVKTSDNTVAGIKDSRQIVRWAFDANAGDVTDKVFECGDKFVLASLVSVQEKGVPPFDEVSNQIRQQLLKEKKGEKIAADMQAKLSGANDLQLLGDVKQIASVAPETRFVPGIGNEPKVRGSLESLAADGNIGFIAGNSAVFAAKAARLASQTQAFDETAMINELQGKRPYGQMVLQSLVDAADMTDNRINFY